MPDEKDVAELHWLLSACTAACIAGLFALTQLRPMGDLPVSVATYAFAFGLPVSASAAVEAWWPRTTSAVSWTLLNASLFIGAIATYVGITALFAHFHIAAGICFAVTSLVCLCAWVAANQD